MWGVEFTKVNSTGGAEFEVKTLDASYNTITRYYRVLFGVNKAGLFVQENGSWKNLDQSLESILPRRRDYGRDWTEDGFFLALTFFSEGFKRGYHVAQARKIKQ